MSKKLLQSGLVVAIILAGVEFSARSFRAAQAVSQPVPAQAPATTPEVIKTESQMVLVDVIATDKKGRHIADLASTDFHVYEDDKEQPIASFSRVTETPDTAQANNRRYIMLFFDDSTMSTTDQTFARKAAADFVSQTASKDRVMAVIDFTGATRIAQNFTSDPAALKAAVENVRFGALRPNEPGQSTELASLSAPTDIQMRTDFAARSVLLAIRSMCKSLRSVPGRKTMILFSGGFALNTERETELSATIDAANKANVAIYPIDVRGLEGLQSPPMMNNTPGFPRGPGGPPGAGLEDSPFPHSAALLASLGDWIPFNRRLEQRSGGGGGGGGAGAGGGGGGTRGGGTGGTGSGGTGGTRGGTGTANSGTGGMGGGRGPGNSLNNLGQPDLRNNPMNQIIPQLMENVTTNQQVLYALADGTGGFVIVNTNNFKAGLDRISGDLQDYYILGYVPPNPVHDGSYHKIKVKVDRHGVEIRARNGYFDVKSPDLLAGKPEGKVLEDRVASSAPNDFTVSVAAPFFYTSPGVARVNLAIQMPSSAIVFNKQKGKLHSEIDVLGIAYRPDGSVAARFSDTVKNDFEKKDMKELLKSPFTYQNTFDIAPGKYDLKVAMSAGGEKFGKFETPLSIGEFTGKKFGMSDVALARDIHPTSQVLASMDVQLLEERTPLVFKGMELIPTADHNFSRQEKVALYCEIYEPDRLGEGMPKVGIIVDFFDPKNNQRAFTTNTILVNDDVIEGSPVIPVAIWLPSDRLQAGEYRVEVRALDALGNKSLVRSTNVSLN